MRTLIFSALAATLCVSPAMAQTDVARPTGTRPANACPADVATQIERDLAEMTRATIETNGSYQAAAYVYGARPGYFGASEWTKELKPALQGGTIQIEAVRVLEHDGTDARAAVAYKVVPARNDVELRNFWSATHQEILAFKLASKPLQRDVTVWQIVPPAAAPPAIENSDSIANQDILLANIAYRLAQRAPFVSAKTPAERSMGNLKTLGLGAFEFAQDYAENFAFEPRYTVEALFPYVRSFNAFQVPDTDELYAFNANLSGKNLAAINEAVQTVMFYEGRNETPIFRYDGKAAICFADGHVALVTPDEAKNLIWQP